MSEMEDRPAARRRPLVTPAPSEPDSASPFSSPGIPHQQQAAPAAAPAVAPIDVVPAPAIATAFAPAPATPATVAPDQASAEAPLASPPASFVTPDAPAASGAATLPKYVPSRTARQVPDVQLGTRVSVEHKAAIKHIGDMDGVSMRSAVESAIEIYAKSRGVDVNDFR